MAPTEYTSGEKLEVRLNWFSKEGRDAFLAKFGYPMIAGGASDDTPAGSGTGQEEKGDTSEDETLDEEGDPSGRESAEGEDGDKAKQEAAKYRNRVKQLRKELDGLKQQMQQEKDKTKSDDEKVQQKLERLEKVEKENEQLKSENEQLKLVTLIQDQNKVKFNIPARKIVKLLDDIEDYRDDNGKLDDALVLSALEGLGKEYPAFVASSNGSESDKDEDGKDDKKGAAPARSTGSGPAPGTRKKQDAGIDRQELAKRFPILRSRV